MQNFFVGYFFYNEIVIFTYTCYCFNTRVFKTGSFMLLASHRISPLTVMLRFLQKLLLLLYLVILASCFLKYDFRTVTTILWKSETHVSIKADSINWFFLLVNIRSIQDDLLRLLKHVGPFVRFLKLQASMKSHTAISVGSN